MIKTIIYVEIAILAVQLAVNNSILLVLLVNLSSISNKVTVYNYAVMDLLE